MLTILMGRAKTGKSDTVLRRIAELGDSSQQILLVPEGMCLAMAGLLFDGFPQCITEPHKRQRRV